MDHHALPATSPHPPSAPVFTAEEFSWARHESRDADAQASSLRGWQQRYDQISPGAYRGLTIDVHLGELQLFREFSSNALRQQGQAPKGMHNFALCGSTESRARFRNSSFTQYGLLAMAEGSDLDLRTPCEFEALGINVRAEVLDLDARLDRHDVIPMTARRAEALRQCLRAVFDGIESSRSLLDHDAARRALCDELLGHVVAVLDTESAPAVDRTALQHARIVARAEEYVLSRSFESVTVADLCRHIGASRRRLQYAFQNVMDTSPHQYLRALRLCRVRRELKTSETGHTSIQDAAARWGFWHVGHFARDYRQMFGERPSDTLRAAA